MRGILMGTLGLERVSGGRRQIFMRIMLSLSIPGLVCFACEGLFCVRLHIVICVMSSASLMVSYFKKQVCERRPQ